MKRLLTFFLLSISLFSFSQIINDSTKILIGGSSTSLLYENYDLTSCRTKGDYLKGNTDESILYPASIFKCKPTYGTEKLVVQVYFNGKSSYYETEPDRKMILLKEVASMDDFYLFYDNLKEADKHSLDTLSQRRSKDHAEVRKFEVVDYILGFKKYGIGILEAVPTENYSMTGAKFEIFNASEKTIKYITFNFYGKNAVNDKVGVTLSRKGIGPIEKYQRGEWEFDTVWLTDIVQTLKLLSVNILYMNGTSKIIKITDSHWMESDAFDKFNLLSEE